MKLCDDLYCSCVAPAPIRLPSCIILVTPLFLLYHCFVLYMIHWILCGHFSFWELAAWQEYNKMVFWCNVGIHGSMLLQSPLFNLIETLNKKHEGNYGNTSYSWRDLTIQILWGLELKCRSSLRGLSKLTKNFIIGF